MRLTVNEIHYIAARAPKLLGDPIAQILSDEIDKWDGDLVIGVALAGQADAQDRGCQTPDGSCDRETVLRELVKTFDAASAHRVLWTLRGTPAEHWLYGPLVEDAIF